ncbi:MAG TPA: lytic transglycosylase F [Vicinamibacterales bacterium]|nr:lytic transglycosylase F [Vicinamibacterales bacterium]
MSVLSRLGAGTATLDVNIVKPAIGGRAPRATFGAYLALTVWQKEWSVPQRLRCICAIVIVGLVSVGQSACGQSSPEQSKAAAQPASTPPATPAPTQSSPEAAPTKVDQLPSDGAIAKMLEPSKGDLDEMIERRYIRMLVTFSKTNYFLDGPEQHGATYDGAKLFEEFLNKRLQSKHIRVQIAFIPVSRERLFSALAEGRGDIAAANLTITPERKKLADFSLPILSDVRELVVTGANEPAVNSPDDLSGRKVHVRKSSSYYESLTTLNVSLRKSGKPPVEIVPANEPLEDEDLLEMVNAGLIPATVVDDHLANFWKQIFDRVKVTDVAIRTGGQVAWALRRNTPQLAEAANSFIKANPKGSLQYNMILKKYLQNTQFVKNAASNDERKKFEDMAQLFRRYGDRYNFPWLLLAAQAYQESTIDQSKKSHVGAVGVMQIKPSTAEGNPINIKGVDVSADRNVEAGAKYLRFMVDRYFKDEPMERIDKGLFAIASYNAGPARVAGLRRKAAAMRLDPNKWFGNVEVVAARDIGRETVQYVSNIYKYYVSYTLISAQRQQRAKARGQP